MNQALSPNVDGFETRVGSPESLVRRRHTFLAEVIAGTGCAMLVRDSRLRVTLANPAALALFPGARSERHLLGKRFAQLFAPGLSRDGDALDRLVLSGGQPQRVVVHLPWGEPRRAVMDCKSALRDRLRRVVGVIDVLHDLGSPQSSKVTTAAAAKLLSLLSPRERQVLTGLVAGQANKAIARDLGISPRTVEIHRANLMDKLDCRSLADVVRTALTVGIGL